MYLRWDKTKGRQIRSIFMAIFIEKIKNIEILRVTCSFSVEVNKHELLHNYIHHNFLVYENVTFLGI